MLSKCPHACCILRFAGAPSEWDARQLLVRDEANVAVRELHGQLHV